MAAHSTRRRRRRLIRWINGGSAISGRPIVSSEGIRNSMIHAGPGRPQCANENLAAALSGEGTQRLLVRVAVMRRVIKRARAASSDSLVRMSW